MPKVCPNWETRKIISRVKCPWCMYKWIKKCIYSTIWPLKIMVVTMCLWELVLLIQTLSPRHQPKTIHLSVKREENQASTGCQPHNSQTSSKLTKMRSHSSKESSISWAINLKLTTKLKSNLRKLSILELNYYLLVNNKTWIREFLKTWLKKLIMSLKGLRTFKEASRINILTC